MPPRSSAGQLALDLPPMAGDGIADFLRADCNAAALDAVVRWPDWPASVLVLHGPAGAGKSHLTGIWAGRADAVRLRPASLWAAAEPLRQVEGRRAVVVDDADQVADDTELFHLHNAVVGAGGWLLLTGATAPAAWPVLLPDLRSRLRAASAVAIHAPDDALLAALLVKQLADRQLRVDPAVIDYLVRRLERSFAAVRAAVAALDRASLRARRPVTMPLARLVLEEIAAMEPQA